MPQQVFVGWLTIPQADSWHGPPRGDLDLVAPLPPETKMVGCFFKRSISAADDVVVDQAC
jgi:hypothetical protein